MQRRQLLQHASASFALSLLGACGTRKAADQASLKARIAALEQQSGGRLGVAYFDHQSQVQFAYRGEQLFPLCSTFKLLLVAAVLQQVDRGTERLERLINVQQSDMVSHSPVVEKHIGQQISVASLCEGTMIWSDNASANLLLPSIGGPSGLTRFMRSIGDTVTRLDRNEPTLGTAIPGDPRDTTSPLAMRQAIQHLLLDANATLSEGSRARLKAWLIDNRTGATRIRAGAPKSWQIGDKTGAGMNGSCNDVALLWPPGRAPISLCLYLRDCPKDVATQHAVHADATRILLAELAGV